MDLLNKKSSFRYDINAIRALAVLLVAIYHFQPDLLIGGFIGVDIFFVISGYLMTSIIIDGLSNGRFSIPNFYSRRAIRIVPPLAFLCLILLSLNWFYLYSEEYKSLAIHVLSSLSFISNLVYWQESGYFASDSNFNWLLHTWSLSVEWQFYVIFPIVLSFLFKRLGLEITKIIIIFSLFTLFPLSLATSYLKPDFSYFNLVTRSWEMLAGSVVFLFPLKKSIPRKVKSLCCIFCFAIIVTASFTLRGDDYWPNVFTLLPVLSTCCIIYINSNFMFSNNRLIYHVGLSSYSIYLWHWPILVFMRVYGYENISLFYFLSISFIVGYFAFYLVEKKVTDFIYQFDLSKRYQIQLSLISLPVLFAAVIFYSPFVRDELRSFSKTEEYRYISMYDKANYLPGLRDIYNFGCDFINVKNNTIRDNININTCISNELNGILLWGDSHAQALSYGFRTLLKNKFDAPFYQVTTSSCKPSLTGDLYNAGDFKTACDRSNEYAKKIIIDKKPSVIFLAQRNKHDEIDTASIDLFLKDNKLDSKVIIVGPILQWDRDLPKVIVSNSFDKKELFMPKSTIQSEVLSVDIKLSARKNSSFYYLSLIDELCDSEACLVKVDDDNTPLVWDYGHLTKEGSTFISDVIFNNIIRNNVIIK